jgi:alkanesulfonate monooxygenase SsuD/methylene tetrahydromethanopterin reductase-like flavin-dependent oxidoreductase (luciferase family)
VQVGLLIPQGWKGEYDGWDAADAWATTVDLARHAEALGFESAWVFDHFTTVPEPTDEITFESFSTLSALAMATERVRLGHMVICTGFRNPALTAKLASTIDVISGGRFEVGSARAGRTTSGSPTASGSRRRTSGSPGWATISRSSPGCSGPGRATYAGEYARVDGAINVPKGIQDHIPIIVGGNGPNVTMRLAARFADELNLVFRPLDEIPRLMATARQRCEEIDRDPPRCGSRCTSQTLRSRTPARSASTRWPAGRDGPRPARRVPDPLRRDARGQERFAEDCRAAGLLGQAREPAAVI